MRILFKPNKINNGFNNLIEVDFNNKTYKTGFDCDTKLYKIIIKTKDMQYLLSQLKENNYKEI